MTKQNNNNIKSETRMYKIECKKRLKKYICETSKNLNKRLKRIFSEIALISEFSALNLDSGSRNGSPFHNQ